MNVKNFGAFQRRADLNYEDIVDIVDVDFLGLFVAKLLVISTPSESLRS